MSLIPRNLNDIAIAKTAAKIRRPTRIQARDQIEDDESIEIFLMSL
jgi:hypothetical protein